MNPESFQIKKCTQTRAMKRSFIIIFTFVTFICPIKSWAVDMRIIDADTIELDGAKVRLNGIDAPEMGQKCEDINSKMYSCGVYARDALQALIATMSQAIVQCHYTDKDFYGRFIGECSIGQININMWLVENGWALAYRKYSKKYVENENIAKSNRVGMWSGKFVEPWNWRRGKRLHSETN